MNPVDQLKDIINEIKGTTIADAAALETFRIRFLGTKNILKPISALIRDVPNEQKKEFGQLVNEAKQKAEELFQRVQDQLSGGISADLKVPDLSLPEAPFLTGSRHPVSIVMEEIINVFARMGFEVAEDREIEDDWHNFTAMNTPEDHPARDMQDTYYVASPPGWLLRTHTSFRQG
jgi:phenylalanyl-tRNA synthetase alpha chain